VVIVFVLIGLAMAASLAGLVVLSALMGSAPSIPSNATLYLPIQLPLPELQPSDLVSQLVRRQPTLREVIVAIDKAKRDSRVKSLVITPRSGSPLWGQAQDLRTAILDFRTSGKTVTAFLESAGVQEYYLASAADRIVLMPAGQLDLTGIATYELFFRGTLDKLGVTPDLLHIGDYKTAANTFTERHYTAAHRDMAQSLNRDWYDELVRAIAEGRKRSVDEVTKLIDAGPYLAEAAMQAGLVDELAYADQLDDQRPILGTQRLDADTYAQVAVPARTGAGRVAVLYAVGAIAQGQSVFDGGVGGVVGSDTFSDWLRKVRLDPAVRAVVVRIDSPGGSAVASEIIWREMQLTNERKPVVVSMGDVAASGGYYIAAPATAIVAEPGTLTGSIGVVTGKFVVSEGAGKLGITTGSVADGRHAEIYSPFKPFSASERTAIQEQMQATYDVFVQRVADGRKRTREQVDAVGQGRVWTGRQALERGLVDELGSLDRAIQIAKERANLDPNRAPDLLVYPQPPSFFEMLAAPLGPAPLMSSGVDGLLARPEFKVLERAATFFARVRRGEMLLVMPNVFGSAR
jgi:protease-4